MLNLAIDSPAERALHRRQAQEWAGLDVNENAELFCFVGRWSTQKGVDLIADVFPAILKEHSNTQLICIGPVIDLYGKFAAIKLDKLAKMYPGRVYSKPEFTALPSYIFSGAEFALIPSRDEPFGLVAVEFGRKGALCVGARVGGLGHMPGWWYTIESTTTKHLLSQFKRSIEAALASKPQVREAMRQNSLKTRFPISQWKQGLSTLQENSIKISNEQIIKMSRKGYISGTPGMMTPSRPGSIFQGGRSNRSSFFGGSGTVTPIMPPMPDTPSQHPPDLLAQFPDPAGVERPPNADGTPLSLGLKSGPGHESEDNSRRRLSKKPPTSSNTTEAMGTPTIAIEDLDPPPNMRHSGASTMAESIDMIPRYDRRSGPPPGWNDEDWDLEARTQIMNEYIMSPEETKTTLRQMNDQGQAVPVPWQKQSPNQPETPDTPTIHDPFLNSQNPSLAGNALLSPSAPFAAPNHHPIYGAMPTSGLSASESQLDLSAISAGKRDLKLQNVEPDFTDITGLYAENFTRMLDDLNEKNSEGSLCIEEYLRKSEKAWYRDFYDAKMGKNRDSSRAPSIFGRSAAPSPERSPVPSVYHDATGEHRRHPSEDEMDQFLIQEDYVPPTGVKRFLLKKIGDWPVYSFFLAFVSGRMYFPRL